MPIQAPQWTDFLTCPVCLYDFDDVGRLPISLGCGHSICKVCLENLNICPFDQAVIPAEVKDLLPNVALLQLLNLSWQDLANRVPATVAPEFHVDYQISMKCIEALAVYLKPLSKANRDVETTSLLSRPLQRKLVTLINCQLGLEDGRVRAVRAARSIGERTVTELILQHQNGQISTNLWAAVRTRGCQFLGPAMQEETLNLVLLALDHGASLSRKVLVLFVVQRLVQQFPQASKTSVGHVVQLLYRASCFKVTKREEESSLMELKEEFRQYDALRKEHDTQIVQIAIEAGLRISPEQWSSLLYGDLTHKSHMQSIIDKLQTPESFGSSIRELTVALQRSSDPAQLSKLRGKLEQLAAIDQSPETKSYSWEDVRSSLQATQEVVAGLVDFLKNHSLSRRVQDQQSQSIKYKTSMCRDIVQKGGCPRGTSCTFAHSEEELERYRSRSRRMLTNMNRQNSRTMDRNPDVHTLKLNDNRTDPSMPSLANERGPHDVQAVGPQDPSPRILHQMTPDPYKEQMNPDFQPRYFGGTSPQPEPMGTLNPHPIPAHSASPYLRAPLPASSPRIGVPAVGRGHVPLGRGYMSTAEHYGHWAQSAMGQGSNYNMPGSVGLGPYQRDQLRLDRHGKTEDLSLQQLHQHKSKIQGMLDNIISPPRNPYQDPVELGMSNLSLRTADHGYAPPPQPPNPYDGSPERFWHQGADLHLKETNSKYTTSISKVRRLHLQGGGADHHQGENPTLGKHTMHEFEQMTKNELEKTLEQEKNAASSHYERSSKIQMEIMRRNNAEAGGGGADCPGEAEPSKKAFVRHPGPVSRKASTYHKTTGPVKVNAGSSNSVPVTLMHDCHVSPGIQSAPGSYNYFQTGLNWNQPKLKLWDSLPDQMSESEMKKAKNLLKAELQNVSHEIEKKNVENSANDSFLLLREESALSDKWPTREHVHVFSEPHKLPIQGSLPLALRAPGMKPPWGLPNGAGDAKTPEQLSGPNKGYDLGIYTLHGAGDRSPYPEKW